MKSKLFLILLFLVALFVVVAEKSQTVHGVLLDKINPIKQTYRNLTDNIINHSKSYIFQKETINKLTKENKALKKILLDQTRYLQQMSALFKKLPSLEKLPYKSIALVDTVSYVKLNSLNKILLSHPDKTNISKNKIYGLIQENVVGGTAIAENGNLYGYLSSNPKCKFSVFIGTERTPGVIEGVDKSTMIIRYIPKWAEIKIGDKVETSGLDDIFFKNIPVGVITNIKTEDRYKTALVKSYADNIHPNFYFLITDARPRLATNYDQNSTFPDHNNYLYTTDNNKTSSNISSIPKASQTKDADIDISDYEPATKKHEQEQIKNNISISPVADVVDTEAIKQPKIEAPTETRKSTPKTKPLPKPKPPPKPKSRNIIVQEPQFEDSGSVNQERQPSQNTHPMIEQVPEPSRPNPLDYFRM